MSRPESYHTSRAKRPVAPAGSTRHAWSYTAASTARLDGDSGPAPCFSTKLGPPGLVIRKFRFRRDMSTTEASPPAAYSAERGPRSTRYGITWAALSTTGNRAPSRWRSPASPQGGGGGTGVVRHGLMSPVMGVVREHVQNQYHENAAPAFTVAPDEYLSWVSTISPFR